MTTVFPTHRRHTRRAQGSRAERSSIVQVFVRFLTAAAAAAAGKRVVHRAENGQDLVRSSGAAAAADAVARP